MDLEFISFAFFNKLIYFCLHIYSVLFFNPEADSTGSLIGTHKNVTYF
jgi:hypothetical protein